MNSPTIVELTWNWFAGTFARWVKLEVLVNPDILAALSNSGPSVPETPAHEDA